MLSRLAGRSVRELPADPATFVLSNHRKFQNVAKKCCQATVRQPYSRPIRNMKTPENKRFSRAELRLCSFTLDQISHVGQPSSPGAELQSGERTRCFVALLGRFGCPTIIVTCGRNGIGGARCAQPPYRLPLSAIIVLANPSPPQEMLRWNSPFSAGCSLASCSR